MKFLHFAHLIMQAVFVALLVPSHGLCRSRYKTQNFPTNVKYVDVFAWRKLEFSGKCVGTKKGKCFLARCPSNANGGQQHYTPKTSDVHRFSFIIYCYYTYFIIAAITQNPAKFSNCSMRHYFIKKEKKIK